MNKKNIFSFKSYINFLLIISIILLAFTLIPMMWIGFYAHPLGDDFYFGIPAISAYRLTGNPLSIFPAAIKGTINQYKIWQGTYSAMFLMHLPPQLFGDRLYGFYPAFILLFFTGSIFFFLKPFFKIKPDKEIPDAKIWIIISSLVSCLCIQFVPLCGETFYWYNGSFYYTGFLSITIYMFGTIFRYRKTNRTVLLVLSVLLAFWIAGGNYPSLLPSTLLLFTMLLNDIISKKKKMIVSDLLIVLVLLTGFAISAFAPGNAVRQATAWGNPPLKTIAKAIYQCTRYCIHWTVPFFFVCLLLLTPVFIYVAKASKLNFKYPIPICIIIYGIYCSSECPTFYAQNNGGGARAFDICYYMMVFTLLFIYYYLIGALIRLLDKKNKQIVYKKTTGICAICFTIICLIFSLVRQPVETFMIPNSVTATISLANGEAAYYDTQHRQRLSIIESANGGDVVVPPIIVPQRLQGYLNCGDISPYAEYNTITAEYYGIKSIRTSK